MAVTVPPFTVVLRSSFRRVDPNHVQQDAVPQHEMMEQRRRGMQADQGEQRPGDAFVPGAKKIAEILSGGEAKADATYKVPFYTWSGADGEQMTVGLKGHVLNPAFPEGYSNWQETDPKTLIDAELVTEPTDKNVVKAVKKLAKGADSIVIATDFDREGELIGLEALREMLEVNPGLVDGDVASRATVQRARYSALTKDEIERARVLFALE